MPKTNATPSFDPAAMFSQFKLPMVDMDALAAAQQRNLEAISTANQVAAEGVKAIAALQGEIVRSVVDGYTTAVRDLMAVKDPTAGAAKQAELAKTAFETTIANTREITELAVKTNSAAAEVLNKRVVEGLDEIKTLAVTAA